MNTIERIRWQAVAPAGLIVFLLGVYPLASFSDQPLPRGHYKLTGVQIIPIEKTAKGYEKSDRLKHGIRFDIETRYEVVKGTESQPFKILNPTVGAKSSLTFDKPIKFKGEDVPAGTNLLKYQKFEGSFLNVSLPDLFPLAIHSATLKQDFTLPADTYTVKFAWTTDQGEVISESVKVYIEVDLANR